MTYKLVYMQYVHTLRIWVRTQGCYAVCKQGYYTNYMRVTVFTACTHHSLEECIRTRHFREECIRTKPTHTTYMVYTLYIYSANTCEGWLVYTFLAKEYYYFREYFYSLERGNP